MEAVFLHLKAMLNKFRVVTVSFRRMKLLRQAVIPVHAVEIQQVMLHQYMTVQELSFHR